VSDWKKRSPRNGRGFWREQAMFASGRANEARGTDRIMAGQHRMLQKPMSAKSLAPELQQF